MSRIHDALQRAEQEKLAAGVQKQYELVDAIEQLPLSSESVAGPIAAEEPTPVFVAAAQQPIGCTPIELSDLVSAMAPARWSPDLHRLLFWSRNGYPHVGEEEFRTLRSRLYRIREQRQLKKLAVGSAVAGEGKTFVTANLGQAMSHQRSRRVLMIDCDLRKPELHAWFGASATPGLTEYLRGDIDEAAVMQRSPKDNLYLIPAGTHVSTPAELLANGRLNTLLERVGQAFDWIICDTPPILPVSDGSQVATLCDGILLVVLAGSTSFESAQSARREFKNAPTLLGVVLNQAEKGQTYPSYYRNYGSSKIEG